MAQANKAENHNVIVKISTLLLLIVGHSFSALAEPSCAKWYTDFLKARSEENLKIKNRANIRDRNFCGGKTGIAYSQCFREYLLSWGPKDGIDVVMMSAILTMTALKDQQDGFIDNTTKSLTSLDGILLVMEHTDPRNFAITKCKSDSKTDSKEYKRILALGQTELGAVQKKMLALIAQNLKDLEGKRQPATEMSPAQKSYVAGLKKRYSTQATKKWKL